MQSLGLLVQSQIHKCWRENGLMILTELQVAGILAVSHIYGAYRLELA